MILPADLAFFFNPDNRDIVTLKKLCEMEFPPLNEIFQFGLCSTLCLVSIQVI